MTSDSISPGRDILLGCDGTSNTLSGGDADTNVLLLHQYLVRQPPASNGAQRVLWYDPGVGNANTLPPTDFTDGAKRLWDRIAGLASGRGVYENIAEGYTFLMRQWRGPQDRIFIYGFSRGAFTARAIAGMVNLFGILRPEHEGLVPTLVHIYFSPPKDTVSRRARLLRRVVQGTSARDRASGLEDGKESISTREALAAQVKGAFTSPEGRDAWVHWVGVWDTVESVGMPGPWSQTNPATATFTDKRVHHARHALALDEHRWPFLPRLYQEPGDVDQRPDAEHPDEPVRTLKQRWFPGVHCDVGGSYKVATAGLSDDALRWMLRELAPHLPGLDPERNLHAPPPDKDKRLEAAARPAPPLQERRLRHDPLWDTPWWALAGMVVRDMRPRVQAPHRDAEPIAVMAEQSPDSVADTVWAKRRGALPLAVATLLGMVATLLSGICLLPPAQRVLELATLARAHDATMALVHAQLGWFTLIFGSSVWAPWDMPGQPAWAMVWDLLYIPCWGYLLARVASRAFAWLAGDTRPGQKALWWRWLGFAPLVAVLGDASEDLFTLAALALHCMGTDVVARASLWLASLGSVVKVAGLAASVPLLLVRLWIMLQPGLTWRSIQKRKVQQAKG